MRRSFRRLFLWIIFSALVVSLVHLLASPDAAPTEFRNRQNAKLQNNRRPTPMSAVKTGFHEIAMEYDFIVVGGGQSGLVVANRLSESGEDTVLVIEYGHLYHDDPHINNPWQPYNASAGQFHDPKLMYNYTSVPQEALNSRRNPVSAGATVGGGSTVNGMFLNRGSREDYDAWEALGNPDWGWDGLLPYFKRSVTFTPPGEWLQGEYGMTFDEEAAYGENGPIHASNPAWAWPGQRIQIAGWKELGVKQAKEGAGGDAYGIFWVPRAQDPRTQTRSYSVTGHLDSAMPRRNFELLTGHRVKRVLLDEDDTAVGVVVRRRDGPQEMTVKARKEVILAAGLHSPLILQRSGIGRQDVLQRAGVPCRVDLPGVGMNLQDHPAAGIAFDYMTDMALNPGNMTKNTKFAAEQQAEFATSRTGALAGGHNAVVFLTASDFTYPSHFLEMFESQSESIESTLEYLPAAYAKSPELRAGFSAQRDLLARALVSKKSTQVELPVAGDAYALHILQKPLARGSILLDPRDPMDGAPLVDFQTLANPVDMEMMVAAMKVTRVWAETEAMAVLSPVEVWPETAARAAAREREEKRKLYKMQNITSPKTAVVEEDDVDEGVESERLRIHIRNNAESSIGHESGTCAMMPLELGGVVAPDLLVHRVGRLSVVDSSIIPLIPSTNLCATVYAVAEKAADLIKQRHSLDGKRTSVRADLKSKRAMAKKGLRQRYYSESERL